MNIQLSTFPGLSLVLGIALLGGCAVQSTPTVGLEASQTDTEQREAQLNAQQAPDAPLLKRKIALGRITNETKYGQSLLRDDAGDPLGKQVTDILSKALAESRAYLVFERPDISVLQSESELVGSTLDLVGVDTLLIGSLTEFGRKTVGERGFLSSTKKQLAFAKVDLRLVDANSGLVFQSVSGAGEASTEAGSVFGFGSRAGYDGTLNDGAIRIAVSDAVSKLTASMNNLPWTTDILSMEGSQVYISGGAAQGIQPGMNFVVETAGKKVKSKQTGGMIQLPGYEIATIEVISVFGNTELDQGAVCRVISGSIVGDTDELKVVYKEKSS